MDLVGISKFVFYLLVFAPGKVEPESASSGNGSFMGKTATEFWASGVQMLAHAPSSLGV